MCFDTVTIRQNEKQKSKKIRRCQWCSEQIEIGEIHFYHVGLSEGDFGSFRMHSECLDAYRKVPHSEFCDLGIGYGEFKRGKWEER